MCLDASCFLDLLLNLGLGSIRKRDDVGDESIGEPEIVADLEAEKQGDRKFAKRGREEDVEGLSPQSPLTPQIKYTAPRNVLHLCPQNCFLFLINIVRENNFKNN